MTNSLAFLLGFLSSSALFFTLILLYYIRARKRVRSIQAAIERYEQARKVVGQAVNQTFAKQ